MQFGRGFKSLELFLNDMIDCKKFRNKKTYAHIAHKKGIIYSFQNIYGSARFHRNEETGRIDDIENIVKILIYLHTGIKPNNKGLFPPDKVPKFLA